MCPLLFTHVAGFDAPVVRVNVMRLSSDAVVKSSANLGSTRSVAVRLKDGVIMALSHVINHDEADKSVHST